MAGLTVAEVIDSLPENYLLDNVLARGGFGEVVKCLLKDTNQAVAVKLPFSTQGTEEEIALLQELMEERMDQRNIVRFIDSFDTRLGRAMVFELLDMSLWGLLEKYDPLPLADIVSIVGQVATALDVLKERSLVHSDLKLDNVMVVDHSQRPLHVKLIDFGLTMAVSKTENLPTIHNVTHRPPEVILGSGWDEGLDVWCLGVIMSNLWLRFNLFPDVEYEALRVMHKLLGPTPEHILDKGNNTTNFYQRSHTEWKLRTRKDMKASLGYDLREDYYSEYFSSIKDILMDSMEEEEENTDPALDLLTKMFDMDKNNRITPKQILQHPAICYLQTEDESANSAQSEEEDESAYSFQSEEGDESANSSQSEEEDESANSSQCEEEDEPVPLSCLEINDILPEEYVVTNMVALGKFGQFVKCQNIDTFVTIKVPYHNNQTKREARLLQKVLDAGMDRENIVKFIDLIETSHGTMLVMENLDMNVSVYANMYYPLPLGHIQTIVKQTAIALQALESMSLIHTGVTADNIYICSLNAQSPRIKLADFGSVIKTTKAVAGMRVQPLAYRAPEVILGLKFDQAIDVWSLGCTLVQMVTNFPLFTNESENKKMETMVRLLGWPSRWYLEKGLKTREFFKQVGGAWKLKTQEEFEGFPNFRSALEHLYFERCPSETDLLPHYEKNSQELIQCLDLAEKMLHLEDISRITADEIMLHPFILWDSENDNAELVPVKIDPVTSPRVIMVKPATPENTLRLQEEDHVRSWDSDNDNAELVPVKKDPVISPKVMLEPVQPENTGASKEVVNSPSILMARKKARKIFDVIQPKDRRSGSDKAEVQEAPVTSPRVIMVKPAAPEDIIELQEVDDVQKESNKVLRSREKVYRTFNVSDKAEVQEAPVTSPRVIMVKPAAPENSLRLQEEDHVRSVSAEKSAQRDPVQEQQQSGSPLNMETKAEDREPALIQPPTSTSCDKADEQLKDRPKRKLWRMRTAKVTPMSDSTLPPTEDDFVPKKKTKNIFRKAFSWLKRCSCF